MPFLSGSLGFERFTISGTAPTQFDDSHIEILQRYSTENIPRLAGQEVHVGFLGGAHLLDHHFDLGKCSVGEALHFSIRIETDTIPGAIRKAWLQMELAALAAMNSTGRTTKAQRQEAKESVQQRCEAEIASGKYRRMQHYPVLWDLASEQLFLAGSGSAVIGSSADLIERAFDIELHRRSAGSIALDWARRNGKLSEVEDLRPASFVPSISFSETAWANEHSDKPDFLGNEFLLWLWWQYTNVTDTITLESTQDVTFMFAKTLMLECPLGEHGKETISSESPVHLPEAVQAVQTGKMPRKAGLTYVIDGEQFDFTLQAETFGVSGAKIQRDESADSYTSEDRINSIRRMTETIDGLFEYFVARRVEGAAWQEDLDQISGWLASGSLQVEQELAV